MLATLLLFLAALPAAPDPAGGGVDRRPPNILVVIADDLGREAVGAYEGSLHDVRTPVLDALAGLGVRFTNAWAAPNCSPARAALLTGQWSRRTGLGKSLSFSNAAFELDPDWPSVADVARRAGHHTLALGKWHLSSEATSGVEHPLLMGFDRHVGTPDSFVEADGPGIYTNWVKTTTTAAGSSSEPVENYATSEAVDDALEAIAGFGDEPWFVWLAFHAPHLPLHAPPDHLHDYDLSGLPIDTPKKYYRAAVQALDTELGRLLTEMRPVTLERTLVIVLGDNGSPPSVASAPYGSGKAKGTVFQGGVNVPFLVAGAGVKAPGSTCERPVHAVDLLPTVAELLDQPAPHGDGVSLLPYLSLPDQPSLRRWMWTETFKPSGPEPYTSWRRAVQDPRYKLIRNQDVFGDVFRFHDLWLDPFEEHDLLSAPLTGEQLAVHDRLQDLMRTVENIQPEWK